MTIEVMKQAADALEKITRHFGIRRLYASNLKDTEVRGEAHKAITALRQAISQPDCRWCEWVMVDENDALYCDVGGCTNGDKFQALAPVRLYKVT